MYVAYGFIVVAILLGASALGIHSWVGRTGGALRSLKAYFPAIEVVVKRPERSLWRGSRLPVKAKNLVDVGRMVERASAAGVELTVERLTPRQTELSLRPRKALPKRPTIPTPTEALDAWMEQESIPSEQQSSMRMKAAEIEARSEVEAPMHLRPRESATRLLDEGTSLEKRLWAHRRDMVRAPQSFPPKSLPAHYLNELKDWNSRVLAFADEHLSVKDAGEVRPYPSGLVAAAALGGPSVDLVEKLIANNQMALSRIQQMK
jgi:hypothetical protein